METFGVYVAGPMTGIAQFNFPMFDKVTKAFREAAKNTTMEMSTVVFNPADHDRELLGKDPDWIPSIEDSDGSWKYWTIEDAPSLRTMLRDDLGWIATHAQMVVMLPGWENSKGANAEWALAKALGLKIIYLDEEAVASL